MRILIAEDDPVSSRVLATTLTKWGHDVVTTNNGLEAGADDYLIKPFDRHELRVRVQAGARIVSLQGSLAQRVQELHVRVHY